MPNSKAVYTFEELVPLLGKKSIWGIRYLIQKGYLKRVGSPRARLVSAESVEAYVSNRFPSEGVQND